MRSARNPSDSSESGYRRSLRRDRRGRGQRRRRRRQLTEAPIADRERRRHRLSPAIATVVVVERIRKRRARLHLDSRRALEVRELRPHPLRVGGHEERGDSAADRSRDGTPDIVAGDHLEKPVDVMAFGIGSALARELVAPTQLRARGPAGSRARPRRGRRFSRKPLLSRLLARSLHAAAGSKQRDSAPGRAKKNDGDRHATRERAACHRLSAPKPARRKTSLHPGRQRCNVRSGCACRGLRLAHWPLDDSSSIRRPHSPSHHAPRRARRAPHAATRRARDRAQSPGARDHALAPDRARDLPGALAGRNTSARASDGAISSSERGTSSERSGRASEVASSEYTVRPELFHEGLEREAFDAVEARRIALMTR
jgi:hypothetical protein